MGGPPTQHSLARPQRRVEWRLIWGGCTLCRSMNHYFNVLHINRSLFFNQDKLTFRANYSAFKWSTSTYTERKNTKTNKREMFQIKIPYDLGHFTFFSQSFFSLCETYTLKLSCAFNCSTDQFLYISITFCWCREPLIYSTRCLEHRSSSGWSVDIYSIWVQVAIFR
jgi:hypothetical protein